MRRILRHRPSPALIVAIVALIMAMGGSAFATSAVTAKKKHKPKHTDAAADTKLIKHLAPTLSVKHAKTASTATRATSATNAANAASAANASALQGHGAADFASSSTFRPFRATLTASGTSFASANTVVLYTDGPLSLVGHCWSNGPATDATVAIRSSVNAIYQAYDNTSDPSTSPVNPGTGDVDVLEADANSTSAQLAGPFDGTWSVMTSDQSAYFTGLGSAGVLIDGSTPCIFTGFTAAS
jgi:hypothetical protein